MFKTEAQYLGHLNVNGVCPMLAIEREVADWNRRFLQDLKERES